jgi:hypothetical protein
MATRKLVPYAGKERGTRVRVPFSDDIDRFKRKRIVRMLDDNIAIDRIAARFGVSQAMIRKIGNIEESP